MYIHSNIYTLTTPRILPVLDSIPNFVLFEGLALRDQARKINI